jgi:hypothetical protein
VRPTALHFLPPQRDSRLTSNGDEQVTNDENGADVTASSFLEALYDDPLRAETARTGRYLVIASAIGMTVVLFNVRLQSTSFVPLDFDGRTDVLAMLVSLAVLLLLLSFILRAVTDLFRDHEAVLLVTRYIENERVSAALKAAQETEEGIAESQREQYEGPSEPNPWWEPYIEIKEAADAAVAKAEARIGVRRFPRQLSRVRKGLEIAIPIVFALVALVLSRASLITFSKALVSALKP